MATIQKREGKRGPSYRVMVRMKGFPDQVRTFKRLTDAKQWAQETESGIRKGEFKNVVRTAAAKTLQDVIDRFRAEVFVHRAESTKRAEASFLNYWERELGPYSLAYITSDLVSEKMRALAAEGDSRRKTKGTDGKARKPQKPKSPKTLKHYRDELALLFKYAIQWGWTASSPLDGVNKITKIRNERTRYLDDDERALLLKACQESDNPQLYPVVLLAISTGARRSEILSLTQADVNLERGTAILRNTKNGDTRVAYIVPQILPAIRDQIAYAKALYGKLHEPPETQWLFPRRDGRGPIDIRKAWENARDAAGLADFRFHDLRHSTASYLAMNGASLVEIAEVLGHRTLQMVRRYAHLSDSHIKDVVGRMNNRYLGPSEPERPDS
ncbi:tyrosine-type recombinase/integrase [Amorphus sp. 3PC139-8]|uniref:tyrosine-type recombinase/integrase n=1 Tax=Amorphus sp. 3PC139-8 TaxID=2735676 RepID=UPI00345C821A